MTKKKKGGGGKLSRSVTVTVRLDPKLRFAADLAARKQRRTVSSFIEWAVEEGITKVNIPANQKHISKAGDYFAEKELPVNDAINFLWDIDEADRFINLVYLCPRLLTHEEEVLWKLIKTSGYFWKEKHQKKGGWVWDLDKNNIHPQRFRKYWDVLKEVAAGELDISEIPPTDTDSI